MINQIFFNPPGGDNMKEYLEIRGTPSMSLDNHYLIFLENELDELGAGNAGVVEAIFDLNGRAMGSNGFLTIRHKDSLPYPVAPGTTDLVNEGTLPAFGSGEGSTIGASFDNGVGLLANSGATAMLIRDDGGSMDTPPVLGYNLDEGNDGLDDLDTSGPQWKILRPYDETTETPGINWTILDSVAYTGDPDHTEFARFYGQVNFGANSPLFPFEGEPRVEEGAEFVLLDYEIEMLARWGNSTGQTSADWHITNVTDNSNSGYQGPVDYRQSAEPHPGCLGCPLPDGANLESNKDVPYGTNLMDRLGLPNYPADPNPVLENGDYNDDGVVDAADYTVWRDLLGAMGEDLAADGNNDGEVNELDFGVWRDQFGTVLESAEAASLATVPEPAAGWLALLAVAGIAGIRRRWAF